MLLRYACQMDIYRIYIMTGGHCTSRAYVSVLAGGRGVVSRLDRLADQSIMH